MLSSSPGEERFLEFTLIVLTIVCSFLIGIIYRINKGTKSRYWLTERAKVIECEVEEKQDDKHIWYVPKITFSYRIENRNITSNKISYKRFIYGEFKEAYNVISDLKPGDYIRIHVNPKNPNQAVFIPGTNWLNYLELVIFLAIIVLLMYGLYIHFNL